MHGFGETISLRRCSAAPHFRDGLRRSWDNLRLVAKLADEFCHIGYLAPTLSSGRLDNLERDEPRGDVDPERLMADAEDFARRQPWLVAGVGLIAGFVLARSLKASSGRRSASLYTSANRPTYGDVSRQSSVYGGTGMTSAVGEPGRES